MRSRSVVFETPGAVWTLTWVNLPSSEYQCWASASGIELTSAPPSEAVVPMR